MQAQYEWDNTKNDANQSKHGLSFERMHKFDWDLAISPDSQFIDQEERELWLGPIDLRIVAVVVVVVERDDGILRIILLRRATNQEINLWKREVQSG